MALKKMWWKNLSCPCNMFCRKLGLVVWKNLLLRKVQWVVTLFELLFPLFPLIFFLAIYELPGEKGVTTFKKMWEENITKEVLNWCGRSSTIAYTPDNSHTAGVMNKVALDICKGNTFNLLPVANERILEAKYIDLSYELKAGVVFLDLSSQDLVSYKIRMNPNNLPRTSSLFPRPDHKDPFGFKQTNDYTRVGPDISNEKKYIDSGFIGLQLFLDRVLAKEITKAKFSQTVSLQAMTYPPFHPLEDIRIFSPIQTVLSSFYQGITWGMCFMIPAVTRNLVGEKQTGITELLRLSGVSAEIQWLGWLIHAAIPGVIIITISVILLGTPVINEILLYGSDPTFVWFLFFLYVLACATFIFAICSIFKKPTIATTAAEVIWVISIIFGQLYLTVEAFLPLYIKLPLQLLPNIGLASALVNIIRLEGAVVDYSDYPLGARWTTLLVYVPIKDLSDIFDVVAFPNLYVIGVLLFDICLYMLLAVYLDGVLPSEFGVRRPWYYFNCNCNCQCLRRWGRGRARVAPAMPPPPPPVIPTPSSTSASDSGSQSQQGENDASKPEKEGKHKHHHHHEHKHKHKHDKQEEEEEKEKPVVTPSTEQNALPSQPSLQQASVTGFEAEPMGAPVGVEILGLYKKFGRKVAVNGVSFRMFTGDIFALLGHNGAGKTTLISMLTGFFAPTSGTAIINGFDITRDLEKARKSIGLCTQHNVLFERLTVSQQLCMFGKLRGLTKKQATEEANWLLQGMSIYDKRNTLAKNLSGGQKRKLCLSMALIGGTKVVVLDEPTSGMDPQARREIWDILLNLRGNRTVLLTTHFMEEADFLGDRIGIMASGQLQCCGTPAFLKKFYGTGYTLKLTLGQQSDAPPQRGHSPAAEAALAAVQKHIPTARFKADARTDQASNEVFLSLPSETATTTALSKMFADLTASKDKLGIKTMGLSQTTMDEVFVKVGEIVEEQQHGGHMDTTELDIESMGQAPKVKNRLVTQFVSLCIKRAIHSWRKWITLIFETVIPVLLVVLLAHTISWNAKPQSPTGSSGRSTQTNVRSSPEIRADATPRRGEVVLTNISLAINLDIYPKPVTTYYSGDTNKPVMPKVINNAKSTSNVHDALVSVGKSDRKSYKTKHVVAAEIVSVDQTGGSVEFNGLFNLYPYHAAPLAINLGTNYLLKLLAPDKNYRIELINHPFPEKESRSNRHSSQARQHFEENPKSKLWRRVKYNRGFYIKEAHVLLVLALLFLVANFIAAPIEERLCKAKQLQMMTGAGPPVYWGAFFTWDYLFYSVIIGLMLAYVFFIDFWGYKVVTRDWALPVLILILMIYGCSAIMYSYLLSLRPSSIAGGFSLVTFLHLITGMLFAAIVDDKDSTEINGVATFIWVAFQWTCYILGRLCPTFTLTRALRMYLNTAVDNSDCPLLSAENTTCPEPDPFIRWEAEYNQTRYVPKKDGPGPGYEEITTKSKPLLGQEILFLALVGLLYLGLLMLFEYKLINMLSRKLFKSSGAFPPNINDEDVYNEMQRVNELVTTRQVAQECLVVHNLCKSFGSFAAVSQLHFGVHYGECFGLLGVNGAGKTTAFRMITGDETPTTGNAFGFGTSIETDSKRFFSNIGYCPQFDAILDKFTGREMLQLFAGLRGISYRAQKQEAMSWLKRFGLQDSANAKCGRYSGGMKRRLSTAMAMIGDPSLILLDEPTSGVDPVSRRQFWKILDKVRESGKSIILTSHSMEECEALCSRLGIMVNGQFQCFGGVQHLKNKFAQGYSLSVKLKQDLLYGTPEVEEQIHIFEEAISKRFEPCIQKDKHQNVMQYHLQNPAITWDVLFKLIEEIKAEFQHLVEDFAVNETSLEEVFLAFARMQYPERKANVSLCAQICTCSC